MTCFWSYPSSWNTSGQRSLWQIINLNSASYHKQSKPQLFSSPCEDRRSWDNRSDKCCHYFPSDGSCGKTVGETSSSFTKPVKDDPWCSKASSSHISLRSFISPPSYIVSFPTQVRKQNHPVSKEKQLMRKNKSAYFLLLFNCLAVVTNFWCSVYLAHRDQK